MSSNMTAWRPDGSGWRAQMGLITHDDNTVSESGVWTMAPEGVSIHSARTSSLISRRSLTRPGQTTPPNG